MVKSESYILFQKKEERMRSAFCVRHNYQLAAWINKKLNENLKYKKKSKKKKEKKGAKWHGTWNEAKF